MIILNSEKGIIENEIEEIILDENVLSNLNSSIKFKPDNEITLIKLCQILNNYPVLFLVYPSLKTLKEHIHEIVINNEENSIKGVLKVTEQYKIEPLILEKNYGSDITPYINIDKNYVLYYENNKGEKAILNDFFLKNIINTKIALSDKENFFINMFDDGKLINKQDIQLTLNEFLLLISKIEYKL